MNFMICKCSHPPQSSKISAKAFLMYCFLTKRPGPSLHLISRIAVWQAVKKRRGGGIALTQEVSGSRTGLYSKQSRTSKQEGEAGRAGDGECDFKEKSIPCCELLQKELEKEMTPMGCSLPSDPHFGACGRRAPRDGEALGVDTRAQLWALLCSGQ